MNIHAVQHNYGVTKKEAMILAVLLDGQTHDKADLRAKAFNGQHSCTNLIPMHIYRMKPKLRKLGIQIIGIGKGRSFLGWKLRIGRSVP